MSCARRPKLQPVRPPWRPPSQPPNPMEPRKSCGSAELPPCICRIACICRIEGVQCKLELNKRCVGRLRHPSPKFSNFASFDPQKPLADFRKMTLEAILFRSARRLSRPASGRIDRGLALIVFMGGLYRRLQRLPKKKPHSGERGLANSLCQPQENRAKLRALASQSQRAAQTSR